MIVITHGRPFCCPEGEVLAGLFNKSKGEVRSITGCLTKSGSGNEYLLTATDGSTWEIHENNSVDLAAHEVGLADEDGRPDLVDALGQLPAVPDAQRVLVDPGILVHVAQLAQPVEPRPADRGGDEGDGSVLLVRAHM